MKENDKELTQDDLIPKYQDKNFKVSKSFFDKIDNLYELWKENPQEVFTIIKNDLNEAIDNKDLVKLQEYWKYMNSVFKFLQIMHIIKNQLKEANIEPTQKNICKAMKDELYGFDTNKLRLTTLDIQKLSNKLGPLKD